MTSDVETDADGPGRGRTDADPQRATPRNGVFHACVFSKCTSRCIYTSYRRQGANLILMVRSFARGFEALNGLGQCGGVVKHPRHR